MSSAAAILKQFSREYGTQIRWRRPSVRKIGSIFAPEGRIKVTDADAEFRTTLPERHVVPFWAVVDPLLSSFTRLLKGYCHGESPSSKWKQPSFSPTYIGMVPKFPGDC